MSVLNAKSFKERNTNLSNADCGLGVLRELDFALHLNAFRLARTQVGHLATVVPQRQFAVPERFIQLKNNNTH